MATVGLSGWNASSRAGCWRESVLAWPITFGVDPTLVRVIFAVLAFFGGIGVVAYLVAWALIPEEGEPVSIAEKIINKDGSA